MGGVNTGTSGGGAGGGGQGGGTGGGGGTTVDLSGVISLLTDIDTVLNSEFTRGYDQGYIEIISLTTGGTSQLLYASPKLVKKAIIQNISQQNVTITTANPPVAGVGIILNAANASGQGGGSLPVGNIDLSIFQIIAATAGVILAIYFENAQAAAIQSAPQGHGGVT